jgi:hypothetical protein
MAVELLMYPNPDIIIMTWALGSLLAPLKRPNSESELQNYDKWWACKPVKENMKQAHAARK